MVKQFTTHDGMIYKRIEKERDGVVIGIKIIILGYSIYKGEK